MNECVIVGQKRTGKTSLMMQIAASVAGCGEMTVEVSPGQPYSHSKSLDLDRGALADSPPPTREIHRLVLPLRDVAGYRQQMWTLYDTPPLNDAIPTDRKTRQAVADLFRLLFSCRTVLHVVDASRIGRRPGGGLTEVDRGLYWLMSNEDRWYSLRESTAKKNSSPRHQLSGYRAILQLFSKNNGNHCYAHVKPTYCVVANKMNLPWARIGKEKLANEFSKATVLTGSTRRRGTMRQIRDFLLASSKIVDA